MSSNIVFHERSFNDAPPPAAPSTQLMIDDEPAADKPMKNKKKKQQQQGLCKRCCAPVRGLACCVMCIVFLQVTIPVFLTWLCIDTATGGGAEEEEDEEAQAGVSGQSLKSGQKIRAQPYANTRQIIAALKALAAAYRRDMDEIIARDRESANSGEYDRIWGGKRLPNFSRIALPEENKLKAVLRLLAQAEEMQAETEGTWKDVRDQRILSLEIIQKHLNTREVAAMAQVSRNERHQVAQARNRAYEDEKEGRVLWNNIDWDLPDGWWGQATPPGLTLNQRAKMQQNKRTQINLIKYWWSRYLMPVGFRLLGSGILKATDIEAMVRYDTTLMLDPRALKWQRALKGEEGDTADIGLKLFWLHAQMHPDGALGSYARRLHVTTLMQVFCRPSDATKTAKLQLAKYTTMKFSDFTLFANEDTLRLLADGVVTEDELWMLFNARDASKQDDEAFAWTLLSDKPILVKSPAERIWIDDGIPPYPPKAERSILWCMRARCTETRKVVFPMEREGGLPEFKRVFPQPITEETIHELSKLDVYAQLSAICAVAETYIYDNPAVGGADANIDFVTWMRTHHNSAEAKKIYAELNVHGAMDNNYHYRQPQPQPAVRQAQRRRHAVGQMQDEESESDDEEERQRLEDEINVAYAKREREAKAKKDDDQSDLSGVPQLRSRASRSSLPTAAAARPSPRSRGSHTDWKQHRREAAKGRKRKRRHRTTASGCRARTESDRCWA